MFSLRLSEKYYQKKEAEKLIDIIKRNPGCCDNVWLNSLYGFPTRETVREAVEFMKESKKLYCDAGISVSLQISNTLGHGVNHMAVYDYSGLVFEGSPVERMVGEYGECSYGCYCPRGEFFRKYIYDTTKMYAQIEPLYVWVDDDLRIYNHAPVNHGCFCDNCISAFNKKHGTSYTRETLVHEMNRGDVSVREKYIMHNREAIAGLAATIARAVHEVSPESHMAYQSSRTNSFLGADFDCMFEPMYIESGKKSVGYRPGGGYYEDSVPRGMLEKALHLDCAIAAVPEYVGEIYPEVENVPNVAFGKSFEGTAKEATLYLAYGCNGLSFAALNHAYETDEYNERLLGQFSKYSPFWQHHIAKNRDSKCSGVGIYISPESYKQKLAEEDRDFLWDRINYGWRSELASIGLPVTNNFDNCPCILLYPEACAGLTENDMKYLLSKPVICDAKAFGKLCDMGYGKYFGAGVTDIDAPSGREVFTDHEINADGAGMPWKATMYPKGIIVGACGICDKDGKTEVLGEFVDGLSGENYGAVNAIINTYDDNGKSLSKWAVFGYGLFETILSTHKRNQIIEAADYICARTLAAKLVSADQAAVIPRVDHEGRTVSVSIQSLSIGESGKLRVVIRNPIGESFSYMSPKKALTTLSFAKQDDGYLVELPVIEPYELITVFCR